MRAIAIPSPDPISSRILEHVSSKEYRPQRLSRLARAIGVHENEYGEFRSAVKSLMRMGRVVLGGGNCVMLPLGEETVIGTFRGHPRGFGFVVPESPTEHGDLFIPPPYTLKAISGDTVAAKITRRGKDGDASRVEGEIVEIIERGQSRFVGELVRDGDQWVMVPDGHALHAPVLVGDVTATRARDGDQVVVELSEFPSESRSARGVIVEVLGRRGDPGIDTLSIIRQYHFQEAFPEAALEDARDAVRSYDLDAELQRREDLRGELILTIDPDEARDFDDAISLRSLGRGQFELGVHIADVSTLVRAGGPLDEEAARRCNSIYLPRHVIPMLPEVLSNGLCSLQEGQPRLTKSAFIRYDGKGNRQSARFANAVIHSRRRLTYRQASDILDGKTDGFEPEVVELLRQMERLARAIRKRRLARGMLVLEFPGIELVLDNDHEVIDVVPEDTSFSHTLIEMFMVEANEAVAELMVRLKLPHMRRIHPEPPGDAQKKLKQFLGVLGKTVPEKPSREDLRVVLESVKGKPESFAVNLSVLRSMAQAEYSPKHEGHYALASEHYSHFTSPIRRYADLVLHRLLDKHLQGEIKGRKAKSSVPSEDDLRKIGHKCSTAERLAEAAERELKKVKLLRLLEKKIGETEPGIVTGITNLGLFVQLEKYLLEGIVRFSDLQDDWWDIHAHGGCVIGQRSGRRIAVGDRLTVTIVNVEISSRELDLAITDLSSIRSSRQAPGAEGRRPAPQDGRRGGRSAAPATSAQRAARRRRSGSQPAAPRKPQPGGSGRPTSGGAGKGSARRRRRR